MSPSYLACGRQEPTKRVTPSHVVCRDDAWFKRDTYTGVAELRAVIDANPFPQEAADDPGHLLVVFLSGPLKDDAILRKTATDAEKFVVKGHEIYIYFGDGAGRSKPAQILTEKKLGVVCTARNWNTVGKLV